MGKYLTIGHGTRHRAKYFPVRPSHSVSKCIVNKCVIVNKNCICEAGLTLHFFNVTPRQTAEEKGCSFHRSFKLKSFQIFEE